MFYVEGRQLFVCFGHHAKLSTVILKTNTKIMARLFSELAAEFISRPQNIDVLEGERAEFACSVSKEAFEVQWLKADTVLEAGDKYDIISDGKKRILVVKESVLDDEGTYAVMVGDAKAKARLRVIGKIFGEFLVHLQVYCFSFQVSHSLEDMNDTFSSNCRETPDCYSTEGPRS